MRSRKSSSVSHRDLGGCTGGGEAIALEGELTCDVRLLGVPSPPSPAAGAVTLERTLEIEKSTHHDIMAMVKAISEQSPTYGGFVHFGATSQDINDTVLALQLSECKVRAHAAGDMHAACTLLAPHQHLRLLLLHRRRCCWRRRAPSGGS
jgi:hypothetical protein